MIKDSRASSVSIVTMLRDERPQFDPRQSVRYFYTPQRLDRLWNPSSSCPMGIGRRFFPRR